MSDILSQTKYKDLFEQLSLPVILLEHEELSVIEANNKAQSFFELDKFDIESMVEENKKKEWKQFLRKIKRSYYSSSFEVEPLIRGEKKYLRLDACCLDLSEDKKALQFIVNDHTDLVLARKKVEELATIDEMTSLFNHRYFKENLKKELERSQRYNEETSLLLFDVDNFKNYNDTNGHPAGDRLLAKLGAMLKAIVRNTDITCRYGGEEFAIICPHTKKQNAMLLAEKIRKAIESEDFEHKEKQPMGFVSVSIGICAALEDQISDLEDFKEKVDLALYEAKKTGRNRCVLWNSELTPK